MTDPASSPSAATTPARTPVAAGKRKPGVLPTVLLGLATFVVLFEFLVFQLNSGNDPALGKSALAANDPKAAKIARPVINRRVVKTKVVHLPPKPSATGTTVPVSNSGSGASTTSSSTVTGPSVAPSPAPTPPPVTSSS
jgi:cytoskeletal protein RodZ